MQRCHPYLPSDLESLEKLFALADAVVPMREIAHGNLDPGVIGLRHDVDDNAGSFIAAIQMAEWEESIGVRSTYFLLHSASYWTPNNLRNGVAAFQGLGHEVGIHVNAIAQAIRTGDDPYEILQIAVQQLRAAGAEVTGSVGHGDELCRKYHFVNDEIFFECPRPGYGGRGREIGPASGGLLLDPVPRSAFGLDYDSIWLPRRHYASDSGGKWSLWPWSEVELATKIRDGQLHMLIHPDWWTQAFDA